MKERWGKPERAASPTTCVFSSGEVALEQKTPDELFPFSPYSLCSVAEMLPEARRETPWDLFSGAPGASNTSRASGEPKTRVRSIDSVFRGFGELPPRCCQGNRVCWFILLAEGAFSL